MLKPSAISDSYKSYPFLCTTPTKRVVTWLLDANSSLIFSFSSSVLSAPNAGGQLILSRQIFLTEELNKNDVRRINAHYTLL